MPFYAIRKGKNGPMIVESWAECQSQVRHFSGARYKKFSSRTDAQAFISTQDENQCLKEEAILGKRTRSEKEATLGKRTKPKEKAPDDDLSPLGAIQVYFDGGSRGNPGSSGAGSSITDADGIEIWSGYKYLGRNKTNNEAEYWGLILGLEAALKLGIGTVIVRGDSKLVIEQMKGNWQVKAPNLQELNRKARALVEQLDNMRWVHLPRAENKRADELANMAMDTHGDWEGSGDDFRHSKANRVGNDPKKAP